MLKRKSYKINFDAVQWEEQRENRKYMLYALESAQMLMGLTKSEIIQKLGDEFNDVNSNRWTYYVGSRKFFGSKMFLVIFFSAEGKVFKIDKV